MGVVLEKSKLAEDLLVEMGRLLGGLRGGLGVSGMTVGALLAASTGIVGATVVAMAMIAPPAMLADGYCRALSAGTVCTAGTLGQIIPRPSPSSRAPWRWAGSRRRCASSPAQA